MISKKNLKSVDFDEYLEEKRKDPKFKKSFNEQRDKIVKKKLGKKPSS